MAGRSGYRLFIFRLIGELQADNQLDDEAIRLHETQIAATALSDRLDDGQAQPTAFTVVTPPILLKK